MQIQNPYTNQGYTAILSTYQINKPQVVEDNNPRDKHRRDSQLQAKYVANHLRDTSETDRVGIPERDINQSFRRFIKR